MPDRSASPARRRPSAASLDFASDSERRTFPRIAAFALALSATNLPRRADSPVEDATTRTASRARLVSLTHDRRRPAGGIDREGARERAHLLSRLLREPRRVSQVTGARVKLFALADDGRSSPGTPDLAKPVRLRSGGRSRPGLEAPSATRSCHRPRLHYRPQTSRGRLPADSLRIFKRYICEHKHTHTSVCYI